MKTSLLVLIGVIGISGCASVPLPREATATTLVPVSSAAVEVYRPAFRMTNGRLALEGYTLRRSRTQTTANSHIDLVYLDGAGQQLRVDKTDFSPRNLPVSLRLPRPHGYFLFVTDRLPAETATIEVRARDSLP
jgi:hypothetical protein